MKTSKQMTCIVSADEVSCNDIIYVCWMKKKMLIFTSPNPYSGTSGLAGALCKKADSTEPTT